MPNPPKKPLSALEPGEPRWKKYSILLQILIVYLLVRLPFYALPLQGEEGVFAHLFVNRPAGPEYCVWGRVDGRPQYELFLHPAGLYETVRLAGLVFSPLIPDPPTPNNLVSPRLRLIFSAAQLAIWLVLAAQMLRMTGGGSRWILLAILGTVLCSPTAHFASTQLQIDGSVGALMTGLLALALSRLVGKRELSRRDLGLLGGAAFYLALGKTEWCLIFAVALGLWGGYLLYRKFVRRADVRACLLALGVMAGALLVGNVLCALYDWGDYKGSIDLMMRISPTALPSSLGWSQRWAGLLEGVAGPHLFTIAAVLAAIVLGGVVNRKDLDPYAILLALFAGGLFAPFMLQTYYFDPRYIAPSLVVAMVACAAIFPRDLGGIVYPKSFDPRAILLWLLAAGVTAPFVLQTYFFDLPYLVLYLVVVTAACTVIIPRKLGQPAVLAAGVILCALALNDAVQLKKLIEDLSPRQSLPAQTVQQVKELKTQGFVPMLTSGQAWNMPDVDYYVNGMPPAKADGFLEKLGKKRWPPDR
jgi:hypothetical protein